MPAKTTFTDYAAALEFIRGGRDKTLRTCGRNTVAHLRESGEIAVVLYNTPVVTYFPDGRIRIRHGGWQTSTTSSRVRAYSRALLGGNYNGEWTIRQGCADFPFVDGEATVDAHGDLIPRRQGDYAWGDIRNIALCAVRRHNRVSIWAPLCSERLSCQHVIREGFVHTAGIAGDSEGFSALRRMLHVFNRADKPRLSAAGVEAILHGRPELAAHMHLLRTVRLYRKRREQAIAARYARMWARKLQVKIEEGE